ncbi:MAG TPA: ATP-binding cassette domain-containing protein [Nocardioides sp.]
MIAHRPSGPVVEIVDGAVAIAGRPVLRHVDVAVQPGEWVAVLGANGSGKSTLVRTMLGLWPLTTGEARLFGTPLERFDHWERVGFVPQRATASSGVPASVWEVVASGRLSRRRPLRPLSRADRRAIADAIEAVGLERRVRDGISTLSGGQQQRALVARALAGEPDLLVLDEPTAGVDLPHQESLADVLHRLSDRGATVVLVAHELGPMRPLVDRALVMRDGMVAYDGAPLTEQEAHAHHHLPDGHLPDHDHVPHIGSPLEGHGEVAE